MTLLPKVKLKTLPTFPASIIGGTGLEAVKANGAVTLNFAWQEFGTISAIPTSPSSHILAYDTATDSYVLVPSDLLGGANAGIADAPNTGTLYGRISGTWSPALPVNNPNFTGTLKSNGVNFAANSGNINVVYNGGGTGGIYLYGAPDNTIDFHSSVYGFQSLDGSQNFMSLDANGAVVKINDQSSVVRDYTKHWYPTAFGQPATGVVHKFNRVMIGASSLASTDAPVSVPDWPETLLSGAGLTQNSQLESTSALGMLAVVGNSRTSDFRVFTGRSSGGSQGITGVALNDDTGSGQPIACAVLGLGVHAVGVDGVTLNQFDVNSAQPPALVPTPSTPFGAGANTWAVGLTSGAMSGATHNCSGALYVGRGGATNQFEKGLLFFHDALNPAHGAGGDGVAVEMYTGQSVVWSDAAGATKGEIFADANGLHLNGIANLSYTPTVTFTGGSGVSASSVTGVYCKIGKLISVTVSASIFFTTAPGSVLFSLPPAMNETGPQAATGFNENVGWALSILVNAANLHVYKYDGTSPVGASGQTILCSAAVTIL